MVKVILFTTTTGFNETKKWTISMENLLQAKKVEFETVYLDVNPERKDEMTAASDGKRQLPQLHVDGKFIGMWHDVEDLNETDELDKILGK